MDLAFFAADTLGVTLYQVGGGLAANEVHQTRLGPWKIEMSVDVSSDILGPTELSFWMTIAKKLRLYVIVKERENVLFVLDEALLKECERTGFTGQRIKERVQEFKPAIKGAFKWSGHQWEQITVKPGA